MIKPDYLSVSNLITGRLFEIPNYQRHYSWTNSQRRDLFDDIEHAFEHNREHFLATIVCYDTNRKELVGSDQYGIFDIVDGQQRVTTLVILLKAIQKDLGVSGEQKEADDLQEILVKKNHTLILLQANHDNQALLRRYLDSGVAPKPNEITKTSEKNIADAINQCERFVKDFKVKKAASSIRLLALLKNNLFCILQVVSEKPLVYTIFEVLNSRGLSVDVLDKSKSLLMGLLSENNGNSKIDELNAVWARIYNAIGIREIPGHEIVRFSATLHDKQQRGRILGDDDALKYLKQYCGASKDNNANIKRIIEITNWFATVTDALKRIHNADTITAVTKINQARMLLCAIFLRNFSEKEELKLTDAWEILTFKIFGIFRSDSRTRVGDYVRLAHSLYHTKKTYDMNQIISEMKDIGADFDIKEGAKRYLNMDCYNEWDEVKYFLVEYEKFKAGSSGVNGSLLTSLINASADDTIEHIFPQNALNENLPSWPLKSNVANEIKINSIGNLTLLPPGVNSALSDKAFSHKAKEYAKQNITITREIGQLKSWNLKSIDDRTSEIIKFAIRRWP